MLQKLGLGNHFPSYVLLDGHINSIKCVYIAITKSEPVGLFFLWSFVVMEDAENDLVSELSIEMQSSMSYDDNGSAISCAGGLTIIWQ